MLEIQDNRLDWKWICADGVIRDHFTMVKQAGRHILSIKKGESITLTAPFSGNSQWMAGKKKLSVSQSLTVTPASTTIYTVQDGLNCLKDTWEVQVGR